MQLSQTMRQGMEMRQALTPRMIQSMEILQLPLMALEERIEQELQANPVLETRQSEDEPITEPDVVVPASEPEPKPTVAPEERPLVIKDDGRDGVAFERLEDLVPDLDNEEFATNESFHGRSGGVDDEGRDRKQEAMNNAPSRGRTLTEHLMEQWALVDCRPEVREAGKAIIERIDADGYLRTSLDEIAAGAAKGHRLADLIEALRLVQTLEPTGVGAQDLVECLLLQLDAIERDPERAQGHDFDLERTLIFDHLEDLELNRYPQISRKLGRPIATIKEAVKRLSRLSPRPGRAVGEKPVQPISPDAVVYFDEDTGRYEVRMANDRVANLYINPRYRRMLKERGLDRKTREFLSGNVRNARWLIESIEQRRGTIERVIRVVVDAQREFFEKGPEYLKPLPMIQVADQLGIHVATVSRAVSEKWIQTPRGIFPLRQFFSGGTTSASGEDMSWAAVKEKLRAIIAAEPRDNPLNDDQIVEKLKEQGIHLARRTVAKYRKLLNIPPARQRREYS